MKCRQAERWLLLKDSGELSSRKQFRLERHLASCAHCRVAQNEPNRLMLIARQSLAKGEPSARTLAAIRNIADASLQTRKSLGWGRVQTLARLGDLPAPAVAGFAKAGALRRSLAIVLWRPALALAAGLLLCLGGWIWLSGHGPSSVGPAVAWEQQAMNLVSRPGEEIDDWIAMLVEDVVVIEPVSDLARFPEINPLGCDLLLLEGLAI